MQHAEVETHEMESLWDVDQAAKVLGLSKTTVYRLAGREDLPSVKIGRVLRFIPAEVQAWVWAQARG